MRGSGVGGGESMRPWEVGWREKASGVGSRVVLGGLRGGKGSCLSRGPRP